MNWADILVLVSVIVLMLTIVFFSFIYPVIIKHKSRRCAYCPIAEDKKIKRAFKDYHKKNK